MITSITTVTENNMVDIHTHILPFIDDGASSYEESLEMLRVMVSNGVTKVVATPHFDFETDNLDGFLSKRSEVYAGLVNRVSNSQIDIEILLGCELMYTPALSSMDLSPFTINNSDYVLIELSTRYDDPSINSTLNSVIANGYIPILAHVERYTYLINHSIRLVELVDSGVLTQINFSSLVNDRYPFVQALFKHNISHLVASDAHHIDKRVANLRKDLISDKILKNMHMVISNELVDTGKVSEIKKLFNKYF